MLSRRTIVISSDLFVAIEWRYPNRGKSKIFGEESPKVNRTTPQKKSNPAEASREATEARTMESWPERPAYPSFARLANWLTAFNTARNIPKSSWKAAEDMIGPVLLSRMEINFWLQSGNLCPEQAFVLLSSELGNEAFPCFTIQPWMKWLITVAKNAGFVLHDSKARRWRVKVSKSQLTGRYKVFIGSLSNDIWKTN